MNNPDPPKSKRRWYQFRLRTMLFAFTTLTILLGWVGWELEQRRRERAAINRFEEMGGMVSFSPFPKSSWKAWTDNWFGERVWEAGIVVTDATDLSPLANFTSLERLTLASVPVSDLSPLEELKNLKYLRIDKLPVSDVSPLAGLTNLRSLSLTHTLVDDVSPLAELKNLEKLVLGTPSVSEEQVQELRQTLPDCKIIY